MKIYPVNNMKIASISKEKTIGDKNSDVRSNSSIDMRALETLGRSQINFSGRDIIADMSKDDLVYAQDVITLYKLSESDKKHLLQGMYDAFKYTDTKSLKDFIIHSEDNEDVKNKKLSMRINLLEFIYENMRLDDEKFMDIFNSIQSRLNGIGESYVDFKIISQLCARYGLSDDKTCSMIDVLSQAAEAAGGKSYLDVFKSDADENVYKAVQNFMTMGLNLDDATRTSLTADFKVAADEDENYHARKLDIVQKQVENASAFTSDQMVEYSTKNMFAVNEFIDKFFPRNKDKLSMDDIAYLTVAFSKRFPSDKYIVGESKDIADIAKQVSSRYGLVKDSDEEITKILKWTDSLDLMTISLINNARYPKQENRAMTWNHTPKYKS